MIELNLNSPKVQIFVTEWDLIFKAVENLDQVSPGESRLPMRDMVVVMILAEYGAIAHQHSYPPAETNLAIVVWPNAVNFCPSKDGLNGVFLEPYDQEKHGPSISFQKSDLQSFTNIEARLDAWSFYSQMIAARSIAP